ncbi:hypothetical protein ZHAS_00006632 [Anopheles sinensis]|uniref:Uncharacterized protein n=1 Tax=Anopheles sinensis TaxID=74873 RepID=A0A084VMT6_ANOSI|nr:hypothetical protein ZHAS_00006632 [Anopheles sinensis]
MQINPTIHQLKFVSSTSRAAPISEKPMLHHLLEVVRTNHRQLKNAVQNRDAREEEEGTSRPKFCGGKLSPTLFRR